MVSLVRGLARTGADGSIAGWASGLQRVGGLRWCGVLARFAGPSGIVPLSVVVKGAFTTLLVS